MRILMVITLWLGMALSVHAAHVTGQVTRIYPVGTTVNFLLSNGCKTSYPAYWQFSISSDMGKAWYAMLLTAAANKTPITVAYGDTCDSSQAQAIWYIFQDY